MPKFLILFLLILVIACGQNRQPASQVESSLEAIDNGVAARDSSKKITYKEMSLTDEHPFGRIVAEFDGKQYNIEEFDDNKYVNVVYVRQFDEDKYLDALLMINCGGSMCPRSELAFVSYDEKQDSFHTSSVFGHVSEMPTIEYVGKKIEVHLTSMPPSGRPISNEKYILNDFEAERDDYEEIEEIDAVMEMHAVDFTSDEQEMSVGKRLLYDLDSDSVVDTIVGEYWGQWETLTWEVHFGDGKISGGAGGFYRVGVLAERTNGVCNIVDGVHAIWVWDGEDYVEREEEQY